MQNLSKCQHCCYISDFNKLGTSLYSTAVQVSIMYSIYGLGMLEC